MGAVRIMADDKLPRSPTALEHLAEIHRLLGRNEARIAGLTQHLEELLRLLEEPGSASPEKDSKSDGSP
jgi:hypothetical protein